MPEVAVAASAMIATVSGDESAGVAEVIERVRAAMTDVFVVAIDGRSGTGKSTLAAGVAAALSSCLVIDGDDFYAGGRAEEWDARSATANADLVIDWRRQRPVLAALRERRTVDWHPYDWDAFDGRLSTDPIVAEPADVVILEGAYSARPELDDLVDVRVLLVVPEAERHRRLVAREGEEYRDDWFDRWDAAEQHYFGTIRPPETFDLVIDDSGSV